MTHYRILLVVCALLSFLGTNLFIVRIVMAFLYDGHQVNPEPDYSYLERVRKAGTLTSNLFWVVELLLVLLLAYAARPFIRTRWKYWGLLVAAPVFSMGVAFWMLVNQIWLGPSERLQRILTQISKSMS